MRLFSVTRKDMEVTWYCSGGAGGQKKNKTKNACRIKHPASGALVTAQERRERSANLKAALRRLVDSPKFKVWCNRRIYECLERETVEEAVEKQMRPENLRTELLGPRGWYEWSEDPRASCALDGCEEETR